MPLYLHQAAYTGESLTAQVQNPEDRLEAGTRPAVEAAGGRLLAGGFSLGEFDLVAIFEAPSDVSAAAVAIAISTGGAVRMARTTRLLSGAEWVEALRASANVSGVYKPALPDVDLIDEGSIETARRGGYL